MNTVLIATAYIEELLESNPNIECIEVWANILYARMKKGCGRNKFISKKGLEFQLPVYYYESNYISLARRYHPDTQTGTSKEKVRKQRISTELQQSINVSREALTWLFKGRGSDGIRFTRNHELFTKLTRTTSSTVAAKLVERLGQQLFEAGYSDEESFGRYCYDPLDEQVRDYLQPIDDEEKAVLAALQAIARNIERLKRDYPEQYIDEENDEVYLEFGF